MKYLLQQGDYLSKEKRSIINEGLPYTVCAFGKLHTLESKDFVPVGSVEFVRKYCDINLISLPANISYPEELRPYLGRNIRKGFFQEALDTEFVKPVDTKIFTGNIKQQLCESVKNDELVWISDPIQLSLEFRYYLIDTKIVGYSRYDDGDDSDIEPDNSLVEQMVADYISQPVAYTIDVGISEGKTVLIEVNDAWAIGYYPWGTMTVKNYVDLITRRWQQIIN